MIHAARGGFTSADWESANAFGFIGIAFVNMLGNVDAGDAQPKWDARDDDVVDVFQVAIVTSRKNIVHAADENWSPNEEDEEFPNSPIFEGMKI